MFGLEGGFAATLAVRGSIDEVTSEGPVLITYKSVF